MIVVISTKAFDLSNVALLTPHLASCVQDSPFFSSIQILQV